MRKLALTEAQCAFVEQHLHLVRFARRDYGWMLAGDECYSDDDVEQIAAFGLMEAVQHYDPEKGSFTNFARHCMKQAIQTEARKMKRFVRVANVKAIRLDAPVPAEGDTTMTWLDVFAVSQDETMCASDERLMVKELNMMLESRLGKAEFLLLQMRISGASTRWIASRLGMSLKWVNMYMANIDKKLEAMRPHLQRQFGYDKSLCANKSSYEQMTR